MFSEILYYLLNIVSYIWIIIIILISLFVFGVIVIEVFKMIRKIL